MVYEKELFLIRLMKITDALIIALSFYFAFFLGMTLRQNLVGLPLAFAPSNDIEGAIIFLKAVMGREGSRVKGPGIDSTL